jgi:cellulose synthase operon protein C
VPPPAPGRRIAPPPPPPRTSGPGGSDPLAAPAPPGSDPRAAPGAGEVEPRGPRSRPPRPRTSEPPRPRTSDAGPEPERLKTRVGVGDKPVEPRVENARKLLAIYNAELLRNPEPPRAGRLHYEIARLHESPLADLGAAAEHFQKAYALCPEHVPTLRGARRVLLARRTFQNALPLFDAELRFTSDPAQKALLLYEKGRVLEDQIGQRREAREAYAAALELDKSNATYLKALERVELAVDAWDSLDHTYERAANAVAGDAQHRAALIVERARLVETHKGDTQSATELYQAALGFDQRVPGALHALKRLHYAHGRWRDLVGVLGLEADQASEPAVRAMAFYRIGKILVDRLGSFDEGLAALEQASKQAPDEPMVLEELVRLYELTKRWEALAAVLERMVARASRPEERVGLLHRIGQICEERLSDETRAIACYERALAEDRSYLPALQALSKLYTRRQQWHPLIAMHLAEADVSQDSARRAAAHARVAELFERELGSQEQAAVHHARALGLAPGYPPSFKALTRILQESGKHRELIELFERAVDEARDAETKITYLFKIGRLHEDALDAAGAALGAYRRILEVDKAHLGAMHAMQRAAERAGRYKELVTALELEASTLSDKARIVALLHRAGEISEDHLDDIDGALVRYKRVIELDPAYAPALASLGRLYYRTGRWEDLLDTYGRELAIVPRGGQSAALLYKMGELEEERIGRDDQSIGYYRRANEMDAFHEPSLHALERKYAERGLWAELVKLIELELSGLKDDERRARTAFRLGEVYESRLAQPEKALAAYDQALAAVPSFRPARDGRVRLLAQARDWKRLSDELGQEATSAAEPTLAVAALLAQGEVLRDELDDARRAIGCFEAVLERDPAHLGALLALEPLYAELGNWDALARVYSMEARVLSEPSARIAALRELARLQESRGVGNIEQARATYIAILQLSPADTGALSALERLALGADDRQLLTHVDAKLGSTLGVPALAAAHQTRLAEVLEAAGDPSALETYRSALARDPENLAAAWGLVRLAQNANDATLLLEAADQSAKVLRDRRLAAVLVVKSADLRMAAGDLEGASTALERALELSPDDPEAARRLSEMLLSRGQVDRLFDALCQAAQWAESRERMAALWIDVARLLAQHKRDVPAALAALHRVVEDLPGHVPTLLELAELYARDRQWAEAVDRLNQVLAQNPPSEIRVGAQLQLARILHDELGDPVRARKSLDAALKLEPNNRDALERLLAIQLRQNEREKAVDTAARLVAVSTSTEQRAEALAHLARLERALNRPDAAAHAYEQAVILVGTSGGIAGELRQLLIDQKQAGVVPRWNHYVAALEAYLEQHGAAVPDRAEIFLELARTLDDEMALTDRALQALQRASALDPGSVEIRTELATRLKKARHYPQAVHELRRLLELDVTRAQTWRDLVEAFRGMQRPEEATLAMAPLVALGVANDLEKSTISARAPRSAHVQPGTFDDVAFRSIDAGSGPDRASELLAALAEGLGKVHPPELERYGLSSRDRISSRSGHPLRMLADRIASGFGAVEFDLYVHRAHAGSLEVELTDPPAILVPAQTTTYSESQQVFLLARPIASIARRLHAVHKLAPVELEMLLAAAVRIVDPGWGAGLADEDYLASHSRRVVKSLSRRARRAVEETASGYAAGPRLDFGEWAHNQRTTSARAALILSDDLPGAISLIRRLEADLAGLKGVALAQGVALMNDLVRFWVSDTAFTLRRRLGMM